MAKGSRIYRLFLENDQALAAHYRTVGWSDSDFCRRNKVGTREDVPNVLRPQYQNFTKKCSLLARPRASEHVDCYPKMGNKNNFYEALFFNPSLGGECFL